MDSCWFLYPTSKVCTLHPYLQIIFFIVLASRLPKMSTIKYIRNNWWWTIELLENSAHLRWSTMQSKCKCKVMKAKNISLWVFVFYISKICSVIAKVHFFQKSSQVWFTNVKLILYSSSKSCWACYVLVFNMANENHIIIQSKHLCISEQYCSVFLLNESVNESNDVTCFSLFLNESTTFKESFEWMIQWITL